MLVQMDIIPAGDWVSPNAEDGVLLADADMRAALQRTSPELWNRMVKVRDFIRESLGIRLREDVFPLSNYAGLYRPLALNRELALVVKR